MKYRVLSLALLLMLICLPALADTVSLDAFPTLHAGWALDLLGYASDGGMLAAHCDAAGTRDHLAVSRFSPELEMLWTFPLPQPAAITGSTECIELGDGQGFAVITLPETDSPYQLFLLSPDGALLKTLTLPTETERSVENRTNYSLLPACILSMTPQGGGVWQFGVLDYEGHTLRTETWNSGLASGHLFWEPFYLGGRLFIGCSVITEPDVPNYEYLLALGAPQERGLAEYCIGFSDGTGKNSVELLCSTAPAKTSPMCATEDGGIVFTFQSVAQEWLSIHIVRLNARHQEVFHLIFDFDRDADSVYSRPLILSPGEGGGFIVRGGTFPFRGSSDDMLFELALSADGRILEDKHILPPLLPDTVLPPEPNYLFISCIDMPASGDGGVTALYQKSTTDGYTYYALPLSALESRTSLRFKTHLRR